MKRTKEENLKKFIEQIDEIIIAEQEQLAIEYTKKVEKRRLIISQISTGFSIVSIILSAIAYTIILVSMVLCQEKGQVKCIVFS